MSNKHPLVGKIVSQDFDACINDIDSKRDLFGIKSNGGRPIEYAFALLIGEERMTREQAAKMERARIMVIRAPANLADKDEDVLRQYISTIADEPWAEINSAPKTTSVAPPNLLSEEIQKAWAKELGVNSKKAFDANC